MVCPVLCSPPPLHLPTAAAKGKVDKRHGDPDEGGLTTGQRLGGGGAAGQQGLRSGLTRASVRGLATAEGTALPASLPAGEKSAVTRAVNEGREIKFLGK